MICLLTLLFHFCIVSVICLWFSLISCLILSLFSLSYFILRYCNISYFVWNNVQLSLFSFFVSFLLMFFSLFHSFLLSFFRSLFIYLYHYISQYFDFPSDLTDFSSADFPLFLSLCDVDLPSLFSCLLPPLASRFSEWGLGFCLSFSMRVRQMTHLRGKHRCDTATWMVFMKHFRHTTRCPQGKVCIVAFAPKHITHWKRKKKQLNNKQLRKSINNKIKDNNSIHYFL